MSTCSWCKRPSRRRLHEPWCRRDANEMVKALVTWVWRWSMTAAETAAYEAYCRTWREACEAAQAAAWEVARKYRQTYRPARGNRRGDLVILGTTWAEAGAEHASHQFSSMGWAGPPQFPPFGHRVLEPEDDPEVEP